MSATTLITVAILVLNASSPFVPERASIHGAWVSEGYADIEPEAKEAIKAILVFDEKDVSLGVFNAKVSPEEHLRMHRQNSRNRLFNDSCFDASFRFGEGRLQISNLSGTIRPGAEAHALSRVTIGPISWSADANGSGTLSVQAELSGKTLTLSSEYGKASFTRVD